MNDILKEDCITNEEEYFFKIDRDLLKKNVWNLMPVVLNKQPRNARNTIG